MNFSEVKLPSNRKFGFFFTLILLAIGIYFFLKDRTITSYISFIIALLFLLTTFLKADLLLPINRVWMRFGLLLGKIVNPIVLGCIYFLLFTPISLLMRLFRRDELRLKLVNRSSHWKERDMKKDGMDGLKKQF